MNNIDLSFLNKTNIEPDCKLVGYMTKGKPIGRRKVPIDCNCSRHACDCTNCTYEDCINKVYIDCDCSRHACDCTECDYIDCANKEYLDCNCSRHACDCTECTYNCDDCDCDCDCDYDCDCDGDW